MLKPCKYPACRNLIGIRSGAYCVDHITPRRDNRTIAPKDMTDESMMAFRYRSSSEWQKIRAHKLRMNPLCEDPHGWHKQKQTTETATQVHHIKSIATHYHLKSSLDNLMAVCYKCHAKFNTEERKVSHD